MQKDGPHSPPRKRERPQGRIGAEHAYDEAEGGPVISSCQRCRHDLACNCGARTVRTLED
jgi:hypothetical protein